MTQSARRVCEKKNWTDNKEKRNEIRKIGPFSLRGEKKISEEARRNRNFYRCRQLNQVLASTKKNWIHVTTCTRKHNQIRCARAEEKFEGLFRFKRIKFFTRARECLTTLPFRLSASIFFSRALCVRCLIIFCRLARVQFFFALETASWHSLRAHEEK